jgi:zinc resistance-associated protein
LYFFANSHLIITTKYSLEITMLKTFAAGVTALALLACAAAYAQQPSAGPDFGRRQQMGAEDRAAFLDARIAALHAGLRLTPDQDKSWPAFEQAYRDLAALRGDRSGGPRAEQPLDPVQRAQRGADALAARSAALKRYADAAAPLYQGLDDNQKRRFGILSRVERPRFHHFAFWRGERGDRDNRDDFRLLR